MTDQSLEMRSESPNTGKASFWFGVIAAIWIAAVLFMAIQGYFDVPASEPAIRTLLTIALPVVMFSGAMLLSPQLRASVMSLDPVLLTEFQAWRILGGIFLAVYAFGHLPGFFAWPAGLGDMAVGIAAPFIAYLLRQNPQFITSSRFRMFHYMGLADFVVAVATGIAARGPIDGFVDQITTAPMGQLPLVLIPVIAVPAFIILHLIVLLQIRASSR